MVNAFGLLASAAREREATHGKEAASHAVLGLLPLLEDGVEQSSERVLHIEEANLSRLLKIAKDPKTLRDRSAEKRERFGRLNRMVHVSRWQGDDAPLLPGNVYEVDNQVLEILSFDRDRLFNSCAGDAYKKEKGRIEPKVIIAEVSPACDYAQNKVDTPGVLGGILMPVARLLHGPVGGIALGDVWDAARLLSSLVKLVGSTSSRSARVMKRLRSAWNQIALWPARQCVH